MNEKATARAGSKPEGWFSRRHQSRDQHVEARENYLRERGRAARCRKAAEREVDAIGRSPQRWMCGHVSSSADHPCNIRDAA